MDANSLLRDQIRHKLTEVSLSSKHVKDVASFLLIQAEHSDFISSQWLEIFKNSNNPSFQLALLYVANEILTKSSKYGVSEFGEALKPVVTQAAQFLKPGPFISKLTKLINYWTYRKVFDTKFTEQLLQKLNATEQVDKKNITPTSHYNSNADSIVKNFNPEKLLDTLRKIKQLDEICESHGKFDINPLGYGTPISSTVSSLKSKEESRSLTGQVDKCCKHLEFIYKKYEERLEHMNALQSILEGAEIYYNVQLKEVAVVVNAYGTYGKRVTKTLSQLHDLIHMDHTSSSSSPSKTTTTTCQPDHNKQSTKYNRENCLNESRYAGDEYYEDLNDGFTHHDDDDDNDGVGVDLEYHEDIDVDKEDGSINNNNTKLLNKKDIEYSSDIINNQSPIDISSKVITDSLTNRINNQSSNIFNLLVKSNNSTTIGKECDSKSSMHQSQTFQSMCKPTPFGFPIFQPVCDASGDVDYRVLLNPTLPNLVKTNDDNNSRPEMIPTSKLQDPIVTNPSEVNPINSLSNMPKMNPHDTSVVVNANSYSHKFKSLHKTVYSTCTSSNTQNNKDTVSDYHHQQQHGHDKTTNKTSHTAVDDEEDNMEVSDGEEPSDITNQTILDKKVNQNDQSDVCSQQDKDWRIFTEVQCNVMKPINCLTGTTSDNNPTTPTISPKNPVVGSTVPSESFMQPTPPRPPTSVRIPPPPAPPPFVVGGLDNQHSFSPPPPLPSTLNELAYHQHHTLPVTKSDSFIPQSPAPPPPPMLLNLKQINTTITSSASSSGSSELTKSSEQSSINSCEIIQSEKLSAIDILKNLCQSSSLQSSKSSSSSSSLSSSSSSSFNFSSNVMTTSISSFISPFSSIPLSISTSSLSIENDITSSLSNSNIPLLSPNNIQQDIIMNSLNSIKNLPISTSSSSSCETNIHQNVNKKMIEDPFAVISRLTGLSNLMKNIPAQSNPTTLSVTSPIPSSNPVLESFHDTTISTSTTITTTTTTAATDLCWKTNHLMNDPLLLSSTNDFKSIDCVQGAITTNAIITTTTVNVSNNSYIPCVKRSRFSDAINIEDNSKTTVPSSTTNTLSTTNVTILSCTTPTTTTTISSSSSVSKTSINSDNEEQSKFSDFDKINTMNSSNDSDSSPGGGDTPTLDERQDDLLLSGNNDKDQSLISFHPFGTPASSLADFLIPNSCHGTDPKSFLSNIPHSIVSQTSITPSPIPSLTSGYRLPFCNLSNSMNNTTSIPVVNSMNIPSTQLSMIQPTVLTANNNPNLSITNSQVAAGLSHSNMMFYDPMTRMPITPRPLVPGPFMISPQQTRSTATVPAQNNLQLPTTLFRGQNWSQSLVNQTTSLQRPPSNDFWALMSTVPPPPPPPPPPPQQPSTLSQPPTLSSFNPTQIRQPLIGGMLLNPNAWMFSSTNRDQKK
ncbi:unnamed protein product [Schistosoma margrebowiei]|uniref:CID domain-containing protein n=1 Tax=Schistosoma margrebowiei TaxID=48269 RepID=A0AA84ZS02_9TREM|nr:unnamed protein product [Schistosoma margrebowiei]